ncbi:hypothetical protein GQ42DRAFT_165977 [Ramicandelaber brevisporus]|nr:hypothetical protein GQ42DRAFT_165977 [Ramicandelaber brevisporus]
MLSTPRSNCDYNNEPNAVTVPPDGSSDTSPPEINNTCYTKSNSSMYSVSCASSISNSRITTAPDSDSTAVDTHLLQLQKLHDDLILMVTKPLSSLIQLKPPFSDSPSDGTPLLSVEHALELSSSDRNDAAKLSESIARLTIEAVTTGMSKDWKGGEVMSMTEFFWKTVELGQKLIKGEGLTGEERTVVARLVLIIDSLSAHKDALYYFMTEDCCDNVSIFHPAVQYELLINRDEYFASLT